MQENEINKFTSRINHYKNTRLNNSHEEFREPKGKIIVFASGKGGVGKTSLAVNSAVTFAKKGKKTLLIDGDLGMANAHALLGVTPKSTLLSFLTNESASDQIEIQTHNGLKFIPGGSGFFEHATLSENKLQLLSDKIRSLKNRFDYIIVDAPAGIGSAVINWVKCADILTVITTSNPSALLDAYGLIKVSVARTGKIPVTVAVNQVSSLIQGKKVFNGLKSCTERFLGLHITHAATVRSGRFMEEAALKRTPLVNCFERSIQKNDIINMTKYLLTLTSNHINRSNLQNNLVTM